MAYLTVERVIYWRAGSPPFVPFTLTRIQTVTFADRLKKLGLRQNEFARILSELSGQEVSPVTVNRWTKADNEGVKNKRQPSAAVLAFLSLLENYPEILERLRNLKKDQGRS